MLLHTKYQGSWPGGFGQEDFFTFSLYKPMKKFDRGVEPFLAPGV